MDRYPYKAFSGYGIEIESMIVSQETLDVAPVADKLLDLVGGAEDMDVPRGDAAWSNELALHVIETKTNGPTSDLPAASRVFRQQIDDIQELLSPLGARLMPTGMHPWMDPHTQTHLWPHQNDEIYRAFDRIFDCRGHGWSNLQSTHINFPFQTEEEFARVHAACRYVLPLLPALAASSPFWDGTRGPALDSRLVAYQKNCARVPSVTGRVVPEVQTGQAGYEKLLSGVYADLAPHDPDGILAHEWVNARGVIARFDRGAIEVRVLDAQECPEQDVCIVALVVELVRALADGAYGSIEELNETSTDDLKKLFDRSVAAGRQAVLDLAGYDRRFLREGATAGELIRSLISRHVEKTSPFSEGLGLIAETGSLAERLLTRLPEVEIAGLRSTYRELCDCLSRGEAFVP